jgi:pilus assembly protein Flp/PilA
VVESLWGRMMRTHIRPFLQDESGATAIEYGMIAALVSVLILVSVKAVGTKLSAAFSNIKSNL